MEAFDLERCGNATMCLGIASAAFETALAYTQERKAFGRELVEFQAVQMKLAEMAMRVEASRLLIYRAAKNAEDGLPSVLDPVLLNVLPMRLSAMSRGPRCRLWELTAIPSPTVWNSGCVTAGAGALPAAPLISRR